MLGELPKLFGRDFAIGFLLPLIIVVPFALFVAGSFDNRITTTIVAQLGGLRAEPSALLLTVFLFLLWLAGVLLLALNRGIIRLKEGYGKWNPALLWKSVEKRRFRNLHEQREGLDRDHRAGLSDDPALREKRTDIAKRLVARFPDSEDLVMPTAFGNTIRAFEVYPRVLYGLDAIPAWPRLLMIMSNEARALVDTAKAQMDFWVNIWFLSLLIFVEYIALVLFTGRMGSPWALASLGLALVASNRARDAAIGWGETVKAAFDVYLFELQEKLWLEQNLNRMEEKERWTNFSRAMIFRRERSLPPRRKESEASNKDEAASKTG